MSDRKLAHNWHEVAVQCMLGTIEKMPIGPDGEVRAKANAPDKCFKGKGRWLRYRHLNSWNYLVHIAESGQVTRHNIENGKVEQNHLPADHYIDSPDYTEIDEAEAQAILASKGVQPEPEPQPARAYPWYASGMDKFSYRRIDSLDETALVTRDGKQHDAILSNEGQVLRDIAAGHRRELTPYEAMMLLDEPVRFQHFPELCIHIGAVQDKGGHVGRKEPKE